MAKQPAQPITDPETTADPAQTPDVPDATGQRRLDFDAFDDTTDDVVEGGETTEQPAGGTTTESEPSLLDRLRAMGIEATDERTGLEALAGRYEQTNAYLERMEQQAQVQEQRFNQVMGLLAQRGHDPTQQSYQPSGTQQTPDTSPWRKVQPLSIPEQVLKIYQQPDGTLKPDAPPEIVREAIRYEQDMRKWLNDAMHNPEQVFGEGVKAVVEQILSERLVSHDRQRDTRTQLQRMSDEIEQHLYAVDPRTGQRNPQMFSEFGQQFATVSASIENTLRAIGEDPSREKVFALAYNQVQPLLAQIGNTNGTPAPAAAPAPAQLPPTPEQIREAQRRKHVSQGRAAGTPQAGGTTAGQAGQAAPARKQNPMLNVGSEFAEAFLG